MKPPKFCLLQPSGMVAPSYLRGDNRVCLFDQLLGLPEFTSGLLQAGWRAALFCDAWFFATEADLDNWEQLLGRERTPEIWLFDTPPAKKAAAIRHRFAAWRGRLAPECQLDPGAFLYRQRYGPLFSTETVVKNSHGSLLRQRTSLGRIITQAPRRGCPRQGEFYLVATERPHEYHVRQATQNYRRRQRDIIVVETARTPPRAAGR